MLPADESLDLTLQARCDGVCAGTPSQLTWLNPVCFGSSAPAAGAKEAVKEALTLRKLLVEGEQQVPGKI